MKTGIKHEYQNWDQACVPGGPGGVPLASCDQHWRHGRACEVRAVGAGLKLVSIYYIKVQRHRICKDQLIILHKQTIVSQGAVFAENSSKHHMVTTCIIFLFHNTSHWCFLPPSDLPTTYCHGKTIYSAAFNDFHSFFQCFCGPLPSISHFCTSFHLPLPSTPVWKSLSVYFLLF